jgi:membrane protease YdiL (CAAX protease family)
MLNVRRTRWFAFLMFLLFVVVSQVLEAAVPFAIVKLGWIDSSDQTWRPTLFIWYEAVVFGAALVAALVVCWVQRRRLRELGLAPEGALRQMLRGSILGLIAPTLLILGIAALGGYSFGTLNMSGSRLAVYTLGWLVAFFLVGLSEEATFRGPSQVTLGEAIGPWPAAIVISLIFGAIHYFLKSYENLADATSVALLGLFMAFTVIRSGSIWFAVGFHALFDYAALFVYGAPNSGNNDGQPIPTKLLTGGYHGPIWLTGGRLGIEASWLVFPMIAALFLGYHLATRKSGYNPPTPG